MFDENIIALLETLVNWTVLPKTKICSIDEVCCGKGSCLDKHNTLGVQKFGQPGEKEVSVRNVDKQEEMERFRKKSC